MKRRFIIYRRKLGGGYYIEDTKTCFVETNWFLERL
jgi:hypothetical protein